MLHYILLHQVVHYIMIKQVLHYIMIKQVSNYLNIFSLLLLIGLSIGLSLTVITLHSYTNIHLGTVIVVNLRIGPRT